jgi:hypothetical protein
MVVVNAEVKNGHIEKFNLKTNLEFENSKSTFNSCYFKNIFNLTNPIKQVNGLVINMQNDITYDNPDLINPNFVDCNIEESEHSVLSKGKERQSYDDLLYPSLSQVTDPSIIGYSSNPQVYVQSDTSHSNPSYRGESSRGDLEQNRGTKRARGDLEQNRGTKRARAGSHIGDERIQVKAIDLNKPTVCLKFDLNMLSPFTEDNSIEWKDNLEVICTEAREAFIKAWGPNMVEKATIDNIYLDYDDKTERDTHFTTLYYAIKKATGKDIDVNNIFLLSKDFIESFGTISKDNVYTETYCTEESEWESESEWEWESEEIMDTTEHTKYNSYYEPLSSDEIQSLIDDLRNRKLCIKSGKKQFLKHLGISLDISSKYIMVGTNDKKEHYLLSRLFKSNKDLFQKTEEGVTISRTSTNKLINNLVNLMSSNDYSLRDSHFLTPLNNDEIQSLIDDLRNRQSCIKSGNKHFLKHLGISLDIPSKYIMVGINDKKVHPLLSKLFETNKELFQKTSKGYTSVKETVIKKLITGLESLKSSN